MKPQIRILTLVAVFATGGTLFNTGCASTPTTRSTGEFVDDASLTAKVKAALLHDPLVQGLQVGVDTFKGTVQLNGFVDTPEEKARAEQLAAQVPGVQTVQNKLTVKTNAAR